MELFLFIFSQTSPNHWVEALNKAYEIIAYLDIAILAALTTVYAIIMAVMRELIKWSSSQLQQFETLREESKKKFFARVKSIKQEEENPDETLKKLKRDWKASLKEIGYKERPFKVRVRRLSLGWIFLTGGLIILSLALLVFSSVIIGCGSTHWCFYMLIPVSAVVFLLWALLRVSLTLYEANRLAREFKDETQEFAKQMLEGLLGKMDDALGLKKAEFKVGFLVNDQNVDTLTIKKGVESWVTLKIVNNSRFAVQGIVFELALPKGFSLRKNEQSSTKYRPLHVDPYPGGALLREERGTLESYTAEEYPFLIKGDTTGEFKLYIFIPSTTHEQLQVVLYVVVTE